jgi:hypothetical protein
MQTIGVHSQTFVDGLNERHGDGKYAYSVRPGRKYDKIVQTYNGKSDSVHAFVDAEGNVYKPAGWAAPAKGIRYYTVESALVNSDPYGSYLYARR